MTFPRPHDDECNSAADKLEKVVGYLTFAVCDQDWNAATGHLQDALAELGFDLVPLRKQPPATPEALTEHDAPLYQYRGEF